MFTDPTIRSYDKKAPYYEKKWVRYLTHTHNEFLLRIDTAGDDHLLDVSAGTGLLARMLIDRNYSFDRLVLNEPSEQMRSEARRRLSDQPGLQFTGYRAEQLPVNEQFFDRIFCLNSFHYYTDQQAVLCNLKQLLKPGGTLYLMDWNRSGFFRPVNRIIRWLTAEHIATRSPEELFRMAEETGFNIRATDSWYWRYWKFLFLQAAEPG